MKSPKLVIGIAVALGVVGAAQAAQVRVYFGHGYYWGPLLYYYPPPAVVEVPVVAPEPQEYIEKGRSSPGDATLQQSASAWYCDASKAYYPYVKQCAEKWRVGPTEPSAN